MQSGDQMLKRDVINIALVPPLDRPAKGEFGWSLAKADSPLTLDDLAVLLPRVAIHWVKMPVWYGESQDERGDIVDCDHLVSEKQGAGVGRTPQQAGTDLRRQPALLPHMSPDSL